MSLARSESETETEAERVTNTERVAVAAAAVAEPAAAVKMGLGAALVADELQDGENSLESGEVITPPHQNNSAASPATKTLGKDIMANKALRKLSQIDTAACEEQVRAILQLEAIKHNELKTTSLTEEGEAEPEVAAADGEMKTSASLENGAELEANEDSEGLYSDTDSSTGEQISVEDVQQARKEKQAEAAAAFTAGQPPVPHRFISMRPLTFHMRPPPFEFARMPFMPRMPRGGMRGMRPPLYFARPPVPVCVNRPGPARAPTPPQTPPSPVTGAYGPALPPVATAATAKASSSAAATSKGVGTKRKQSDLMWTSQAKPAISYVFNLVSDCGNSQHKGCQPRQSKEAENEKPQRHQSKERQRRETQKSSKKSSKKSLEKSYKVEREREKAREEKHRIKEHVREKEKDYDREKSREKVKDHEQESYREKAKDKDNEKHRDSIGNREKDRDREKKSKVDRQAKTPPKRSVDRETCLTPPLEPHMDLVKDMHTPKEPVKEEPKAIDIFAESPPRLSPPPLKLENIKAKNPLKSEIAVPKIIDTVERSTTPPLPAKLPDSKTTPLHKASEIHSRIDALLQDQDLHLEALLATKEQLMRKTNEHRGKASQRDSEKKKEEEREKLGAVRIKQEPPEPAEPRHRRSDSNHGSLRPSEPKHARKTVSPQGHANPFKHETVLKEPQNNQRSAERHSTRTPTNFSRADSRERRTSSTQRNGSHGREDVHSQGRYARSRSRDRGRNSFRNGSRASDSHRNLDKPPSPHRSRQSHDSNPRDRPIKVERNQSRTPPLRPRSPLAHKPVAIKVESNTTPPLPEPAKPGHAHPSPDTDDYIDNWENDDSQAGGNGDSSTPNKNAPLPSFVSSSPRVNGLMEEDVDDEDDDISGLSGRLWNTNSTPPPKAKKQVPELPQGPPNSLININDLYDKFMRSIKMAGGEGEETKAPLSTVNQDTLDKSSSEMSKNSSFSNSTAEESSSTDSSTSSSSSDDDDDEDDSSSEESSEEADADSPELLQTEGSTKDPAKQSLSKHDSHKRNAVSKDLKKLKSLEDNLARIQMMRENYDSGDDICEELLKMESLFLMQKNAIMEKYRKNDLKLSTSSMSEEKDQQDVSETVPASPVNNIFNANREAIKLTISPLKLTRKSAILDKDEAEPAGTPVSNLDKDKRHTPAEGDFTDKLIKPAKEIAIVKPTIVDTKSKRGASPPSRRTRERSPSRSSRTRRSSLPRSRPGRSVSPRRWRPPSPRFAGRPRFGKRMPRSRSRSITRSRSRSRSPFRRRRSSKFPVGRRRNSLSPLPPKQMGPRSPPPPRRRSYSRERYSRSPLPFKPPSPPMRRSWSSSRSPPPTRRRSRSPRSRSMSPTGSRGRRRSRSRSPFADYFEPNSSLEAAAAYYYNICSGGADEDPSLGENYEAAYAAYMDYNMSLSAEDAYAQYMEFSNLVPVPAGTGDLVAPEWYGEGGTGPTEGAVLRELPKAQAPVTPIVPLHAVQKGNVLEIVPSGELTVASEVTDVEAESTQVPDDGKPKRKRVNFVDRVLPNYESDSEDRAVIKQAIERKMKEFRERNAPPEKIREELLALPVPPPPPTPKPAHLEKAICTLKKSKFRYFHFEPFKGTIVPARNRHWRPRFDPKYMAMLVRTGRLPMPPFPFHALRHRPPLGLVKGGVVPPGLKENFVRIPTHPPPPLGQLMPGLPGTPPIRPPFPTDFMHLRTPPPYMAGPPPTAQPIPVVGRNYTYPPTINPGSPLTQSPQPRPVVQPVPPVDTFSLPTAASAPLLPLPLPSLPMPLPMPLPLPLPLSSFTVSSIPTIKEIMPLDILQKIGPLPKTLDLDGNLSVEEDSKEVEEEKKEPEPEKVMEKQDTVSADTENGSSREILANSDADVVCSQHLVETL